MNNKKKKLVMTLFWILSFTWALPTTILGGLAALCLVVTGHKPKKWGPCWQFPIANGYGLEMGLFFLSPKDYESKTLNGHEVGHQLQACFLLGPIQLFVVGIPSAMRFWLREMKGYGKKVTFATAAYIVLVVIGIAICAVGAFTSVKLLLIIGAVLTVYFCILGSWLLTVETPKYRNDYYPPYDSVWFEGDASKRGAKFIQHYFPEYWK